MVNFGDIVGHTNKERSHNALKFAWIIVGFSMILIWVDGLKDEWKWGPSKDLLFMGVTIDTDLKYYSLIPFMLLIDVSLLNLKFYPKAQLDLYLVLPLDQIITDYTRTELFSMGMQTVVCLGVLKFYSWNFLFNRFDILLMSFSIKLIMIAFAFKYRISQMQFQPKSELGNQLDQLVNKDQPISL